ncbi:predicted protein [Botrytis cinerea T4]|uniref:Uncharacterized protein n=1 Tax=Botryotinia fuckeliana (strain T4) TaxID=999810 RepID=G2YGS2_BOTF4|nr:predicted protein [Botrytis cinerea T4]
MGLSVNESLRPESCAHRGYLDRYTMQWRQGNLRLAPGSVVIRWVSLQRLEGSAPTASRCDGTKRSR